MQPMVNKPALTQYPLLLKLGGLHHGFTNSSFSRDEIAILDSSTATAKQVHKDKLIWVDAFEKRAQDADGLATFNPGLSIGVFSADCTPVLAVALHSSTNKVYEFNSI
jgi:copper oxidase (laccase) domain-containing protein